MDKLKQILDTLVNAPEQFMANIPDIEKQMFRDILLLLKDMELDNNGNIIPNLRNIKLVQAIKLKLKNIVLSKEYLSEVKDFVAEFNKISNLQSQYFGVKPSQITKTITEMEIDRTLESLAGAGYPQETIGTLGDMLIKNVTSGSSYNDLVDGVRNSLMGTGKKTGMLSRYAQTYTTDALSQFTGQHINLLTKDLNLEWFMYVGSMKETSREFCKLMVQKKYIHKSELPIIMTGNIDGHQCEINRATGLPTGMIAGTTEENLIVYCGGYNCQHKLVPVAKEAVPKDIRKKQEDSAVQK